MRRLSAQSLMNVALHYVRRYAATEKGLTQVLERRVKQHLRLKRVGKSEAAPELAPQLIAEVVRKLVVLGYLDDARVAQTSAQSWRAAGRSTRAIQLKLRRKGVPEAVVAMTSTATPEQELVAAVKWANKKRLGKSQERRQKDYAAMMRAGFSFSIAKQALAAAAERYRTTPT